MLDISVIPKGNYCNDCSYWRHRSQIDNAVFHSQNYGYCLFLGKGDIELNSEKLYTLTSPKDHPDFGKKMIADDIGLPLSLLWDGVKECGENYYTDEELEELYGSQDKL